MEKVGLQLYSIKELTQKDFIGAIEKVAKIGYDGVEFAGYFDTPAKDLKAVLGAYGIKPAGSHIGLAKLKDELDRVIEYCLEIGDPYIICPSMPANMRDSADAWKRNAEFFNTVGEKCKANGIRFGYHNHAYEFEVFDGKFALDILVENTQPDLMFVELDTFWVEYMNLKSVDFINKYNKRCSVLHIKDMKSPEEKINTEIGKGIMDFKEITSLGKKIGVEWYTVEQEEFEVDQLYSIKESLTYMREIL